VKTPESGKSAVSLAGLKTFSSLQNPVYRLYFLGMLGQFASMNMQQVTGSLLIYRLTGSSALLGSLSLANAFPMIVLSIFGGAIADRMQKKQVLMIGLIASGVVSFGVALALMTGTLSRENVGSWWILMVSSFIQGAVMGYMLPARQSIIPEIVSREHALNAVALNTLGMNVLALAAPGVAGFMIDAFDFKAVYFTMTALYLYGAIVIFFLPHTSRVTSSGGTIINDIKEGLAYIRRDLTILFVLVFTLMVVVLSMPYRQLLPIFVDDILDVGATGMGILLSVSGGGAMIGSLVMASFPNKRRGIILITSSLISGVALVSFAFCGSWSLSLAFMVFVGLGQTLRGTLSSALLQSYTEAKYMGRVMSILMMEWGIVSLCTFIAGLMAEVMDVRWVVGGFALTLLLIGILTMIFVPRIRKLD
jgi:MFS transporter, DHA1 family, staphyloferrin A biosynthesis exporter